MKRSIDAIDKALLVIEFVGLAMIVASTFLLSNDVLFTGTCIAAISALIFDWRG